MNKKKIFLFLLTIIAFSFGKDSVYAAKAVCKYSGSSATVTVTIEDDQIKTSVGYALLTKVTSNNLTTKNFETNDGKLKCLDEIWYSLSVSSSRQATFNLSYQKTSSTKLSMSLSSDSYVENDPDDGSTPPVVYDYVCQYGSNYLSYNSTDYKIQLNSGYSLGAVYFGVEDLIKFNGCPSKLYFVCTTRGTSMCAVSLDSIGQGSFIDLTTDEVPNHDDIENPDDPDEEEPDIPYRTGCGIIGEELSDKLSWFLDIVKYGGVLLAISLGMLDFAKAVFADEADANKKAGQKFIKRIIAASLIFIVPLIIQMLLNIVEIDGVDQDSPFCIQLDN